jgi:methylmalonyl-CoA mutase N-terminal domain/subunit
VIAHESGVTETVDPLAGSYCIEALTDEIEAGARRYIEKIDAMGGMVAAIESGYPQREIQGSAYAFQRKVESGEQVIVGVNRYQEPGEPGRRLFRLDPDAERARVTELERFRRDRDAAEVEDALRALEEAALGEQNLFPAVFHSVESLATLGEISDVLRKVFGTFQERIFV